MPLNRRYNHKYINEINFKSRPDNGNELGRFMIIRAAINLSSYLHNFTECKILKQIKTEANRNKAGHLTRSLNSIFSEIARE